MEPKQDTFNETVSTLLERKVRHWLSGVIDDMRRSSPVQNWLDSMPPAAEQDAASHEDPNELKSDESNAEETSTANTVVEPNDHILKEPDLKENYDENLKVPSAKETWKRKPSESGIHSSTPKSGKGKNKLQRDFSVQSEGYLPKMKNQLFRDSSLQSDGSGSSGSSVLNVLGSRREDAEEVLIALGFGPTEKQQKLQRIPDRFLVPSKLKGISTERFVAGERRALRSHECGARGYRGLTGNPHVQPSSIVSKIMEALLQAPPPAPPGPPSLGVLPPGALPPGPPAPLTGPQHTNSFWSGRLLP